MEILSLACEIIYGEINLCLQTAIMPCLEYGSSLFIRSWLLQAIPGTDVIVIIVM